MIIFPAMDILGGKCVRLYKGDYASARKVAEDPSKTVAEFLNDGATHIHLVDLDGAKGGTDINSELFLKLRKEFDAFFEIGGGIRNIETVKKYIDGGMDRVILGSAAVKDPKFLKRAVDLFGEKISVGIDARNEFVSTSGWLETQNLNYIDFAVQTEKLGVSNIIVTDIGRDGTLEGVNIEMLLKLKQKVKMNITASGGVKNLTDIENLAENDFYGAICGRSLYDGTLSLRAAVEVCGKAARQ